MGICLGRDDKQNFIFKWKDGKAFVEKKDKPVPGDIQVLVSIDYAGIDSNLKSTVGKGVVGKWFFGEIK